MADAGTAGAPPKEQRYLSLNPDVEFDPRVACLSARLYKMFIAIRMMAMRGEEPGVLDIAWPALCKSLGVRSPRLQEAYAQELEDLRLIGFRKSDEAVVLARWTMPQLDVQKIPREPMPAPRKRYPSDAPEARRKRPEAEGTAQEAQTEQDAPSVPLQQFFGDGEPIAELPAESCGVAAESAILKEAKPNKEIKKEAKASPPNPPPAESTAESIGDGQAGGQACVYVSEQERRDVEQRLIAQNVNAGNAHKLAFAPDLDIGNAYAQIDALPDRNGDDPPALLVTAIREKLPFPKAYLDRLEAQEAKRRIAEEQREAERRREAKQAETDTQLARILAQTGQNTPEPGGSYVAL